MSIFDVGKGKASAYFEKINSQLSNLANKAKDDERAKPQYYSLNRVPWIMSTTEWLEQDYGIVWWCNPSDISWNIRLRQATSKNANSTVTHNWPNNTRGTHFDEFVLNMTLQTGSLMPYNRNNPYDNYSTGKDVISPGLVNFYDFLKLLDAPKITAGKNPGRANHVVIKYNSNIFPKLTLIGQFDPEGIKFNDTSQDPNNVNSWNATFIVYDSNPRLSDNTHLKTNSELLNATLYNMFYNTSKTKS